MTEGGARVDDEALDFEEEPRRMPSAEARRLARGLMWGGIAAFWIVVLALGFGAGFDLVDAILLGVLLAAVPTFAIAQVPLVEGIRIERMPAYWSSIVTLWILGTASWLVGVRDAGASAVGLVGLPASSMVAWTLGLTVGGVGIILGFHWIARRLGLRDSEILKQLLPRTNGERVVFAVLSVAAGSGEELAYRGYAILVLAPLVGLLPSALLSTVAFGVVHAYQGPVGILRTGLMGGVLAWGFLASGSLWPAIAAHTLIDLVAGILLGERLLVTREAPAPA